jgi:hypothetical protein
MVSNKAWTAIAVTAVILGLLLTGCGGGDGGGGTETGKVGSVTGLILDYLTSSPLGNVTVTIDGKSAVTDGNGRFTVNDIRKGKHEVDIVPNPDTNLVLPPGSGTLSVTVYADQTVELTDTVYLWDKSDIPPDPPTSMI